MTGVRPISPITNCPRRLRLRTDAQIGSASPSPKDSHRDESAGVPGALAQKPTSIPQQPLSDGWFRLLDLPDDSSIIGPTGSGTFGQPELSSVLLAFSGYDATGSGTGRLFPFPVIMCGALAIGRMTDGRYFMIYSRWPFDLGFEALGYSLRSRSCHLRLDHRAIPPCQNALGIGNGRPCCAAQPPARRVGWKMVFIFHGQLGSLDATIFLIPGLMKRLPGGGSIATTSGYGWPGRMILSVNGEYQPTRFSGRNPGIS